MPVDENDRREGLFRQLWAWGEPEPTIYEDQRKGDRSAVGWFKKRMNSGGGMVKNLEGVNGR